jgi:hypothetical protein
MSNATATSAPNPTSTTLDLTDAAVLTAYRRGWLDISTVEGHFPVNQLDPILSDNIAGDELQRVQLYAAKLHSEKEYLAGLEPDTRGAIVTQLFGTNAVVADCNIDRSTLRNGLTNQVVSPASGQRTLVNAEVQLIGGVWKMTEFSNVGVTCANAG